MTKVLINCFKKLLISENVINEVDTTGMSLVLRLIYIHNILLIFKIAHIL